MAKIQHSANHPTTTSKTHTLPCRGGRGTTRPTHLPSEWQESVLTSHDPLGLIGLHVACTLSLSRFAFEIVLGIKGIRVVISDGHLQGRWQGCESTCGFLLHFCSQPGFAPTNINRVCARRAREGRRRQEPELAPTSREF